MSPVHLVCPPGLLPGDDSEALLNEWARRPGVAGVVGLPDLHHKRRTAAPTGAVLATRGVVYPDFLDAGLGCGVLLARLPREALSRCRPEAAEATRRRVGKDPREREPVRREEIDRLLGNGALRHFPRAWREDAARRFGWLGGGNHFLEVLRVDEVYDGTVATGDAFALVHSGSGRLGRRLAHLYQQPQHALRRMRSLGYHLKMHPEWLLRRRGRPLNADSRAGRDFIEAVEAVGRLAAALREEILRQAARALDSDFEVVGDFPHNHVGREEHGGEALVVHRHGAVGVRDASLLPIASAPGGPTFLVLPSCKHQTYDSCNHGTGQMHDGEHAPQATQYKGITNVMEAMRRAGMARSVARAVPLLVVKFA